MRLVVKEFGENGVRLIYNAVSLLNVIHRSVAAVTDCASVRHVNSKEAVAGSM